MQNKSLFESPPSLFVPNWQRLSSPHRQKIQVTPNFLLSATRSNSLHQITKPRNHWQARLEAGRSSRRSNGRCRDRSFHSHNVGCGWCVPVRNSSGGDLGTAEPPNSSVQHNRSLPPAANGEQLSTWLERRRGGRRAPLRFLFPTPTTLLPSPPLSQPLSESPPPPLPPLPPPTVKRQ